MNTLKPVNPMHTMIKPTIAVAALAIAALAGCSPKNQLDKSTIVAGMNDYLNQRGDLCTGKNQWPIDVSESDMGSRSRNAVQLPVLEKLGLVKSVITVADIKDEDRVSQIKVMRFDLTPEGRKYYLQKDMHSLAPDGSVRVNHGDFCAARLHLDQVVAWDAPHDENGVKVSEVTYTYRADAYPWAMNTEAQKVFPVIANVLNHQGTGQLKETFVLTPTGWRPREI